MSTIEFESKFFALTTLLNSFAYSLTKDRESAGDLYQETAFRALKNRDKFTAGTNFKAWTMTIMKNIFINGYRKRSRAKTVFDSTDNQHLLNTGGPQVSNRANANILSQELHAMIESLDEGLKQPFKMHYEGYKYQEIAREMDLPLGTVKSRIFFARRELKTQISNKYGEALRSYADARE